MTTQKIQTLPTDEKIRLMEAIWEDMRHHYESAAIPQDMINILKERRACVERGETRLLEWDKVKFAVGRG